ELLSWVEFISVTPGTLNAHFAFKVALQANGIATIWWQLGGAHDGAPFDMFSSRPMTTLAAHPAECKDRKGVSVLGSCKWRLHTADMAALAACETGKVEGHLARI